MKRTKITVSDNDPISVIVYAMQIGLCYGDYLYLQSVREVWEMALRPWEPSAPTQMSSPIAAHVSLQSGGI